MLLHLDEFDESNYLELHFEPDRPKVQELLEDVGYTPESGLTVDLVAVRSGSAVRFNGHVKGDFAYTCGRCISEREHHLDAEVEFVVLSRAAWDATYEEKGEIELGADDLDVSFYDGEKIDLAPLVREALILELPNYPVCPDELREACDEAYEAYVGDDVVEEIEEAGIDLRWGPLKELKEKMKGESDE